MKYQLLGTKTGLLVSEFALGTAMFGNSSGYGSSAGEAKAMFTAYKEAGGNFIDTSDYYQFGEAEKLVGEFISAERNRFVIATKYSRGTHGQQSAGVLGNHRKAMRTAVEGSLKRLNTDYIDLYMAHFDDHITPMEEIVRGMEDLVKSGKILYAGLSNFPAWRIAHAATLAELKYLTPFSVIQLEYNLTQRAADKELLPMASAFGLGVMAYSPMAGGLLTGKYRHGESGRITLMQGGQLKPEGTRNTAILDALVTIATEKNAAPGQIAIAWVKAKGLVTILGARTAIQLNDVIAAGTVSLSVDQLTLLNSVSEMPAEYPHNLDTLQMVRNGNTILFGVPERIVK